MQWVGLIRVVNQPLFILIEFRRGQHLGATLPVEVEQTRGGDMRESEICWLTNWSTGRLTIASLMT